MSRSLRAPVPCRCAVGLPCQLLLPREPPWTSTHARTPRTLATSPTHAPQLPFEHRPHPLSLFPVSFRASSLSLALYPRRSHSPETRARRVDRPAHQKPPRAWFSLFASGLSQFGLAGVHSRRFAVSRAGSGQIDPVPGPVLVYSIPLPSLELVRALARSIPHPRGRDSSPELPPPTWSFPSVVLSPLVSVSWLEPYQRVCRAHLAGPGQLW
jgi:hypothetical protein